MENVEKYAKNNGKRVRKENSEKQTKIDKISFPLKIGER